MTSFNEESTAGAANSEAPTSLAMDDSDLLNIRKPFAQLRSGVWMPVEATARERKVAKTGTFSIRLWCNPVDENGDAMRKGRAPLDIYVPLANKGFINPNTGKLHERPNTVFGCYMTALALLESFPRYAKKLRAGVYETAEGEVVDQIKATALNEEIDRMVVKTAVGWYNDDLALVGRRFYAFIEAEQGQDGKTYTKVSKTRRTPPSDEQVLTTGFFDEVAS